MRKICKNCINYTKELDNVYNYNSCSGQKSPLTEKQKKLYGKCKLKQYLYNIQMCYHFAKCRIVKNTMNCEYYNCKIEELIPEICKSSVQDRCDGLKNTINNLQQSLSESLTKLNKIEKQFALLKQQSNIPLADFIKKYKDISW